jgi:hypothetical protein
MVTSELLAPWPAVRLNACRAARAYGVRVRRLAAGALGASALCATLLVAAPASAQTPPGPFATPPVTITSDGPLTRIFNGRRFQCQVDYRAQGQYFPPESLNGQCGTYITLGGAPGGTLYGQPFGSRIPNLPPLTPSTAWSQPGVTGTGSAADPYTNKTTVRLPGSEVYVRENVRYVTGENFLRADIIVQNQGGADVSFRLYHAVDCHPVTGGVFGLAYGVQRADGPGLTSIGCAQNPGNTPAGWVQSLVPLTGPHGYQQGFYVNTWGRVANTRPLTNFVFTDTQYDAAMALSWDDTLPAGGQATYSYLAGFSPNGVIPPNPLTPEPLPPEEPDPGTPEEPDPGKAPPPPDEPATVVLPGPVFADQDAAVAGVSVRCRAIGSNARRACVIETRRGNRRRVFVLGERDIARLRLQLSNAQRERLRRTCATEASFRVVVYQPSGRRARVVRRVVQVLCARLRGLACAAQTTTVFTASLHAQATLAALRARERPRARVAC